MVGGRRMMDKILKVIRAAIQALYEM